MSKMYPQLNDCKWLYQQYWDKRLPAKKIGNSLGCSKTPVIKALRECTIRIRTNAEAQTKYPELSDRAWIIERYCEQKSTMDEIANFLGCNHVTVMNALDRLNIKKREKREALKHRKIPKTNTKPERIFIDFYKKFGLENGIEDTRDNSFRIGRVNPDFIIRDSRIAIFINGDYWHSALLRPKLKYSNKPKNQINECKWHKWKALIIWESDLIRKDAEKFVLSLLRKEAFSHPQFS